MCACAGPQPVARVHSSAPRQLLAQLLSRCVPVGRGVHAITVREGQHLRLDTDQRYTNRGNLSASLWSGWDLSRIVCGFVHAQAARYSPTTRRRRWSVSRPSTHRAPHRRPPRPASPAPFTRYVYVCSVHFELRAASCVVYQRPASATATNRCVGVGGVSARCRKMSAAPRTSIQLRPASRRATCPSMVTLLAVASAASTRWAGTGLVAVTVRMVATAATRTTTRRDTVGRWVRIYRRHKFSICINSTNKHVHFDLPPLATGHMYSGPASCILNMQPKTQIESAFFIADELRDEVMQRNELANMMDLSGATGERSRSSQVAVISGC